MDDRVRAVLDRRTERYAAAPESAAAVEVGRFVGCRVGGTVVGLPVGLVHEMGPLRHWTPLRGPRPFLGITHVRGEAMALVGALGELTGRATAAGSFMVVLEGRGGRAAAPMDEVLGARTVRAPELIPAAQAPALARGAVSGVTTDLWFLLDAGALAAALDLPAGARAER